METRFHSSDEDARISVVVQPSAPACGVGTESKRNDRQAIFGIGRLAMKQTNKRPLVASPPWTAADDERLRALAIAGEQPTEIAEELQRSAAAVRHRFYKLGIPLRPKLAWLHSRRLFRYRKAGRNHRILPAEGEGEIVSMRRLRKYIEWLSRRADLFA